ncbi:hypothetical protein [Thomasclavelia spiroformis]|uniref:hypothetical protein n=1 Tax=Thomasclavelia spiroformis TaxID=29348 RepID=UPI0026DCA6D9|nr:hypothetical protein [Thomasclavelia spiroformis]
MSNKLVFVPLAYKQNYSMSANMKVDNDTGIVVYLKNALVSLISVKKYNTGVQVALVTNFTVPNKFRNIFEKNDILIFEITFDNFIMPPEFKWSLAFFKISALEYVVKELNYDYYLELDSDEICINSFDDMWYELNDKLLMYVSRFRFNHSTRKLYSDIYCNVYKLIAFQGRISKTGGGFIAGNKNSILHFIDECNYVYSYLKENVDKLDKNIGDELYTSIYYAKFSDRVKDASPYVDVYWTSDFYYVSTNYKFDAVSLLHLPDEKQRGLLYIYDYFMKNGTFPSENLMFKYLSFPNSKRPFSIIRFWLRIKRKLIKPR